MGLHDEGIIYAKVLSVFTKPLGETMNVLLLYFDRWNQVYELHIRLCYSKDVSNAWDHKNPINMSQKGHFWKPPGATRTPVARETGGSIRGAAFQLRRLKTKGKFNTLTRNKVTLISVSSRHCPHCENTLVYQKILFSEVVNRLLAMRRGHCSLNRFR